MRSSSLFPGGEREGARESAREGEWWGGGSPAGATDLVASHGALVRDGSCVEGNAGVNLNERIYRGGCQFRMKISSLEV